MIFIITYDLINPSSNYEELLKKIKSHNSWAKLGRYSFIISSNEKPAQIRDGLKTVLQANDKLFVGIVKAPAAWIGLSDDVSQWIRNNFET
jgi:hypothetical protein